MSHRTMAHDTLTLARRYEASPARVFAVWADPEARLAWGAPSEDVTLVQEAADFSVGGEDIAVCVVGGEPAFRVHTRYLDIVPDRRIVLSEVIEAAEGDGRREGVSLVGAEMMPDGGGTRLALTIQTTALDGSDLAQGVEEGWGHALDALGRLAAGAAVA